MRRWAWFLTLYFAGVAVIGLIAFVIRWALICVASRVKAARPTGVAGQSARPASQIGPCNSFRSLLEGKLCQLESLLT